MTGPRSGIRMPPRKGWRLSVSVLDEPAVIITQPMRAREMRHRFSELMREGTFLAGKKRAPRELVVRVWFAMEERSEADESSRAPHRRSA
jgi:hypothetical protein